MVIRLKPGILVSERYPYLEPYDASHRYYFSRLVQERAPLVRDGLFILLRDFVVCWRDDAWDWYKLTVPAGFVTDIASVPLIIQMLTRIRNDGRIRSAALVHDLLYQLKELVSGVPAVEKWEGLGFRHDPRIWPKAAADKLFAKLLKAYDAPLDSLTYWGVRLGGGIAYASDDPARFYTAALYGADEAARNGYTSAPPVAGGGEPTGTISGGRL